MPRLQSRAWIALIAIYLIWGSTYLAIAIGIETWPPLIMAGTRFIVAGVAMLAVAWRRIERRPSWIELRNAAIIGTGLCLGGNGLVTIAEARIASGTAALLVATVPLWLTGLDRLLFGVRLAPMTVAGLVTGFIGTGLLVRPGGTSDTTGALLVVTAAALWASASLFARRTQRTEPPAADVGLQMLLGGVATLIAATLRSEWGDLDLGAITTSSWLAWGWLIVGGSIAGFSAYVWLLRNVDTHVAGTYAFVNPVIAVILGAIVRSERLDASTLIAGAIVVVSVAAIITGGTKRAEDELEPAPEPA